MTNKSRTYFLGENKLKITCVDWLSVNRHSRKIQNITLRVHRNWAPHETNVRIVLTRHLPNQTHDQELEILVPIPQVPHLIEELKQSIENPDTWHEKYYPQLKQPNAPKLSEELGENFE